MSKLREAIEYIETLGYTDAQVQNATRDQYMQVLVNGGIIPASYVLPEPLYESLKIRIMGERVKARTQQSMAICKVAILEEFPLAKFQINGRIATIYLDGKPEEEVQ